MGCVLYLGTYLPTYLVNFRCWKVLGLAQGLSDTRANYADTLTEYGAPLRNIIVVQSKECDIVVLMYDPV